MRCTFWMPPTATDLTLPPVGGPAADPALMAAVAAEYGIETLGPPGLPG